MKTIHEIAEWLEHVGTVIETVKVIRAIWKMIRKKASKEKKD